MIQSSFIFVVLVALFLLSACLFQPLAFDEEKWIKTVEKTAEDDVHKENFKQGKYFNPWLPQADKSFSSFLRWRFSRSPDYSEAAQTNRPEVIPDLLKRILELDHDDDFIVWIGHATFLFRLQGRYWLTDPIFSKRALLPKRVTPPPLQAHDLAALKAPIHVILSHNHYDHLDKDSIKKLPENALYFVPEGLGEYVSSITAGEVIEMNWWEEQKLGQKTIVTCLPAQHWSRRIFQSYNTTLWASFMVKSGTHTVYFGGDSGYFKGYREIGKEFSSIDYALLPITAYQPRWFMHYTHMDSKEAIRAFHDLGASYFIPTQWGTFHLGDNPPGLPPLDLKRNIVEQRLDPAPFLILDIGEIHMM